MVDELWSKTVAGNASVFKKVYPQIGLDKSPVKEIIDVPSESQIIYDARDLGSDKGTADTDMMTQDPKIYFPHMGGVYDYFIKAIQTILRPQEMPSEPIDLSNDDLAKPPATLNEYVSWYLNGSVYHGQNEPLALKDKDEEEYLEDSYKIINFSGPLNKLLSQHSQWRNYFQASDNPKDLHQDQYEGGKVNQIKERPRIERHNQIEACVLALTLDFPIIGKKDIGGIPFPCSKFTHEFHWWLPSAKSGTGPISGSCDPGTGPCSVENLLPYFGDAQTAKEASIICNCESGSNPSALNDGCLRSTTVDYSVGLFQINALVHCPGAFTGDPYNLPCKVVNQAKLDACVEKWLNPEQNIQKAVQLYNESGWIPWACASTCGII